MRGLLVALLFLATPGMAAELLVEPQSVAPGGVFWVRLEGLTVDSARVEFAGRSHPLKLGSHEAEVLLGVDLDAAPGRHPLRVVVHEPKGQAWSLQSAVQVEPAKFAEERLVLPDEMVNPKGRALERIQQERTRLLEFFTRVSSTHLPETFLLPVADPVGSPFGLRRVLNGTPRSSHSGLDFRSPRGRIVRSPAPGEVLLVADLYYTGQTVVIDHGGGLISLFAHLDKSSVRPGDLVETAADIGQVGSTGRATGPHLHWSVRLGNARVDPLEVQRAISREKP